MKGSVRQPLNEVQPQEHNLQQPESRLSNGRRRKCVCVEKQPCVHYRERFSQVVGRNALIALLLEEDRVVDQFVHNNRAQSQQSTAVRPNNSVRYTNMQGSH